MDNYILSICIPTYNRASYLTLILENYLIELNNDIHNQKIKERVQLVIVDGSSTDNTDDVVERYKDKCNLKYYKRENRVGIDRDIMKCIEIADGKYCWLFSDDDGFANGSISKLVSILTNEKMLTGCFCNRTPFDHLLEKKVAEVKGWPGRLFTDNTYLYSKSECFTKIGMDFGFISSQVVNRQFWQEIVSKNDVEDLCKTYYLMVHIIAKMMDNDVCWLYIHEPLVKQRTGNDSLLNSTGILQRQIIEHNNFEKIILRHFEKRSITYFMFFKKMVWRLPRVIANLKSQRVNIATQVGILNLYFDKYRNYRQLWFRVVPLFLIPNLFFVLIRRIYFKFLLK
jgi:abequosyltransferase